MTCICPKCSWFEGLNLTKFTTYAEIIKNLKTPEFSFIIYDISNINDNYNSVFNNIRVNNNQIIKQIKEEFQFNNDLYVFRGIICCLYAGHFTGLIINLSLDYGNLKKGKHNNF